MHAAHKAAAPTGDWLSTVYFQDSTHPSRFGQKLVAGVMAHRLTRQLVRVRLRVGVKVKVRVRVRVKVRIRVRVRPRTLGLNRDNGLTRQLVHRQPDPHPPDQTAASDDGAPPPAQRGDSHRGKRKFLTQQAAPTFTLTMTLAPTLTLTLTLTRSRTLALALALALV